MSIERRRDSDRHPVFFFEAFDEVRQIALEVNAEGEEIRQHDDGANALACERGNGVFQQWACFKERGLVNLPAAMTRGIRRDNAHGVIGRSHARTVPEYDNASLHSYKMIRGSSGSTDCSEFGLPA